MLTDALIRHALQSSELELRTVRQTLKPIFWGQPFEIGRAQVFEQFALFSASVLKKVSHS